MSAVLIGVRQFRRNWCLFCLAGTMRERRWDNSIGHEGEVRVSGSTAGSSCLLLILESTHRLATNLYT